jgi:hypothetical protein
LVSMRHIKPREVGVYDDEVGHKVGFLMAIRIRPAHYKPKMPPQNTIGQNRMQLKKAAFRLLCEPCSSKIRE